MGIQYLQVVQTGSVNAGSTSSATFTLNNVANRDLIVVRTSWQAPATRLITVSDTVNGAYNYVPGSQYLQNYYNLAWQWHYVVSQAGSPVITATLNGTQPNVILEATELIPWEVIGVTATSPNTAPNINILTPGGPQWNNLNVVQEYIKAYKAAKIYLQAPYSLG